MAPPTVIRARLTFKDDARRKIVWSPPDGDWFPYDVDIELLRRKSLEARNRLGDFVTRALAAGARASGAELKAVAAAGRDLYDALFLDAGGGADPEQIARWLKRQQESRITFTVEDRIHIPWGLVYDGDPAQLSGAPEDIDLACYADFWCLKYRLSTLYNRIPPPDRARPPEAVKLVSVVNQEAFERAVKDLTDDERAMLEWLQGRFGPVLHRREDLLGRWQTEAPEIDILYFYCHADGATLVFGHRNELTMDDFRLRLKKRTVGAATPPTMVFLNGCSTASGDAGGGFLEATGSPGYCGFLGTEAPVPDLFALRFGISFLYSFLNSGDHVYEVMHRLRAAHWPLSLVYSVYCYPPLRVAIAAAAPLRPVANASLAKSLGTKVLASA